MACAILMRVWRFWIQGRNSVEFGMDDFEVKIVSFYDAFNHCSEVVRDERDHKFWCKFIKGCDASRCFPKSRLSRLGCKD